MVDHFITARAMAARARRDEQEARKKMEETRTDVKEDPRLFFEGSQRKVRFNTWLPFSDRFWPFSQNRYGEGEILTNGTKLLLLAKTYDSETGRFEYKVSEARTKVLNKEHPNITKAFVGFMLLSPDAAMAALLIPESAKNPIG